MAAAVVELNSLPDAIRPAARIITFAGARVGLARALVIRIEVRSEAFKLRRARVHSAEHSLDAEFLAPRAHLDLAHTPRFGQLRIADAEPLGGAQLLLRDGRERAPHQLAFEIHDFFHLAEEPRSMEVISAISATLYPLAMAKRSGADPRGRDQLVGDQALIAFRCRTLWRSQAAYALHIAALNVC